MATITGVEIARTGRYDVSTGPFLVTPAKLAAAVAAYESGQFGAAVVKLGHTDDRFVGDGEPALGTVQRLRLADGGRTLLADLDDVPGWLAAAAPGAYPRRSLEADQGVTGPDGTTYPLVLRAVALLGQTRPGIHTLADLKSELITASTTRSSVVVLASDAAPSADNLTARQRVMVRAAATRRRHRAAADILATIEKH